MQYEADVEKAQKMALGLSNAMRAYALRIILGGVVLLFPDCG